MEQIKRNLEAIRARTLADPRLSKAHHFLYDLPLKEEGVKSAQFIIMGLNPGEHRGDWTIAPNPTEETSDHDYHGWPARGELRWTMRCWDYCRSRDIVQTELFFWSSKNTGDAFENRFGCKFDNAVDDLSFCRDFNLQLIDHHRPRAVLLPFIGKTRMVAELYDLKKTGEVHGGDGKKRIIETYVDELNCSWLFMHHWTSTRGMTNKDREKVAEAIHRIAPAKTIG